MKKRSFLDDEETQGLQRYQSSECSREERLVFTGLEADRIDHLAGSAIADAELQKFEKIAALAKQAELDVNRSHDAVEPVSRNSVTGSSVSTRWVISWKDAGRAALPLPRNRRVKARFVARGFADPAHTNGQLVNAARMAPRGTNQIAMSAGSAKGCGLRKIDTSAAFSRSDPIRRTIWLALPWKPPSRLIRFGWQRGPFMSFLASLVISHIR